MICSVYVPAQLPTHRFVKVTSIALMIVLYAVVFTRCHILTRLQVCFSQVTEIWWTSVIRLSCVLVTMYRIIEDVTSILSPGNHLYASCAAQYPGAGLLVT